MLDVFCKTVAELAGNFFQRCRFSSSILIFFPSLSTTVPSFLKQERESQRKLLSQFLIGFSESRSSCLCGNQLERRCKIGWNGDEWMYVL